MLACLDRVIGSFFNDSLKILFDQASKNIPNISLRTSAKVILNSFFKKKYSCNQKDHDNLKR